MTTARATKKQQLLLEYVDTFIGEHGYGPSYREIMRALGYKSVSTVAIHIDGLIAKGYLARRDNSPRSLEVVSLHSPSAQSATPKKASDDIAAKLDDLLKQPELSDADRRDAATLIEALRIIGRGEEAEAFEKRLPHTPATP